jgi:Immunoglobulin-like domain of bacterial spore germination
MRDRRTWLIVAAAAVVLLGMLWFWSSSGSEDDLGALTPSQGTSLSSSPTSSESGTTPSPTSTGDPSESPSGSVSRSPTPSASSSKSPTPVSSIADDGLPVVTIEQPTRASSVGIPVQISGTAVAFEAVLRWEILDSKGKRFTNGPAYADVGAPERGHWEVEVELPIGSYTVVAFVESPKDGSRIAEARVKFRAG